MNSPGRENRKNTREAREITRGFFTCGSLSGRGFHCFSVFQCLSCRLILRVERLKFLRDLDGLPTAFHKHTDLRQVQNGEFVAGIRPHRTTKQMDRDVKVGHPRKATVAF